MVSCQVCRLINVGGRQNAEGFLARFISDKIQPIRLAGPKDSSILVDMTLAYVAGWGSDGVNLHTILLKYTPIPLISKSRCHLYWQVDFRNICTKPRLTSDACQVLHERKFRVVKFRPDRGDWRSRIAN